MSYRGYGCPSCGFGQMRVRTPGRGPFCPYRGYAQIVEETPWRYEAYTYFWGPPALPAYLVEGLDITMEVVPGAVAPADVVEFGEGTWVYYKVKVGAYPGEAEARDAAMAFAATLEERDSDWRAHIPDIDAQVVDTIPEEPAVRPVKKGIGPVGGLLIGAGIAVGLVGVLIYASKRR